MDVHSTTVDTSAVGFVDEPQTVTDYADLHALEAGGCVAIAYALAQWGVPALAHAFSIVLAGWLS